MQFMNKYYIVLVLILVVAGGVFLSSKTDTHEQEEKDSVASYEIYPGKVSDKIENGEDIILLDVRTPEEHEEIHLENSLLLPVGQMSQATLENIGLGQDSKDKEIILYCRSGSRSRQAYEIMESLGYTNIKSVSGGMVHWQEDNYGFTESGPYEGASYESTQNSQSSDGPQVTLLSKTYDFGAIPKLGGTVTTDFVIKNTGVETLEIGELTTSCSCTSATISSSSIDPDEEATVTVVFDPNFHEEPQGKFTRTVFIPTNDPSTPEAEVNIKVEIIE